MTEKELIDKINAGLVKRLGIKQQVKTLDDVYELILTFRANLSIYQNVSEERARHINKVWQIITVADVPAINKLRTEGKFFASNEFVDHVATSLFEKNPGSSTNHFGNTYLPNQ